MPKGSDITVADIWRDKDPCSKCGSKIRHNENDKCVICFPSKKMKYPRDKVGQKTKKGIDKILFDRQMKEIEDDYPGF